MLIIIRPLKHVKLENFSVDQGILKVHIRYYLINNSKGICQRHICTHVSCMIHVKGKQIHNWKKNLVHMYHTSLVTMNPKLTQTSTFAKKYEWNLDIGQGYKLVLVHRRGLSILNVGYNCKILISYYFI